MISIIDRIYLIRKIYTCLGVLVYFVQYDAREKSNRRGAFELPQHSIMSRTPLNNASAGGVIRERERPLGGTTGFGVARDEASLLRTASELLAKTSQELALKTASAPSRGRPASLAPPRVLEVQRPDTSSTALASPPPTRIPRLSEPS